MTQPGNRPHARPATPTATSGQTRPRTSAEGTPGGSADQLERGQGEEQTQREGYAGRSGGGAGGSFGNVVRNLASDMMRHHAEGVVHILGIDRAQVGELLRELSDSWDQEQ